MAAISSLVGSVPQIGPSWRICRDDGYSKRRGKNSVVSIRGSRLPLFSSQTRCLLEDGPGRSSLPRKKSCSWEQRISIFGEPLIGAPFPRKYNSISSSFCQRRCSSWQSRGRHRLKMSTPSAFPDRTSFCLSNRKLEKAFVKDLQIPYATVGPDEPHAASTSWPDGILEKQEPDLVYPGVEQSEIEAFLSSELPSHPKLYRGQLKNGLRYLILPNKVPPTRFEAHMEVHVGSIDEEEDEQGIAHMIEHVAFLGSKKREKLLGTGARSNASREIII